MKKITAIILAALIGSAVTIGAYKYFDNNRSVTIEYINPTPVQNTTFNDKNASAKAPLDFTEIAERVMPAVVHIKSIQTLGATQPYDQTVPQPFEEFFNDDFLRDFFGPRFRYRQRDESLSPMLQVGTGSGVIISKDGHIVTNNHVIDQAQDIEVTLHDNRVFKGTVIGTDPATDLALLKIDAQNLTTMPLVDSDEAKVGEWVLAVGNPFNLNSTVTAGIISAKGRSINILRDQAAIESFIQTDAAINQGNSGGALVNLQGGLIGINTAIASPTGTYSGYGFAVPSNIVKKVVADIVEFGSVQRGALGILIRGVDAALKREEDLNTTAGVFVDSLLENSAAGKAGIKRGDVIISVDGRKVNSASELRELVARRHPGDKVELAIDRFGKKLTYTVVLQNAEGKTSTTKNEKNNILNSLGASFKVVDSKTARRLQIDGGVQVIKLENGKLRRSGMREGFIITAVDGNKLSSIEDLAKNLSGRKGGVMLEGVYEDAPGVYYYAFGL